MTNDQMREAFEAWCRGKGLTAPFPWRDLTTWQAAYAAGMERAAGICRQLDRELTLADYIDSAIAAGDCADAIRAEIQKG